MIVFLDIYVVKALTAQVGRLPLSVGWKINTVSFDPQLPVF